MRCWASRVRSSSRMISTSLATITSGSSTVALLTAKSMIRSPNTWRASASARCSIASRISARSASSVSTSLTELGEVVVTLGQELLAQVEQLDLEVRELAAQLLDPVVLGEGDVEALRLADLEADQLLLPAGDHPVLADDDRQPIGAAALERLAVDGADELHAGDVALRRRPAIDRPQRRLLLAQLVDDLLDLLVGHLRASRGRTSSRCTRRARTSGRTGTVAVNVTGCPSATRRDRCRPPGCRSG